MMRAMTAAAPAALGVLACCLIGFTAASPAAFAQAYPSKPVRVVIPWPPGGANDIAGRTVMLRMADSTGQPVVIDNRGGAGGTIGTDHVAKSAPDGYTLLVQSVTHVANAHLYQKLPYDTLRDFAPVALLTAQTAVLVVHPSLPVKSVKEFVALARARPDQLMYSTAGNGSIPHLSMALLGSMTGTTLVHVPYKGGGPQVVGLLGGEAQASLATIASVIAHIKTGRLRALGVASARRSPTLPDVPTIAESGVPGYELSPWIGLMAPATTPRPVIDRLNAEANRALKLPEVASTLSAQALDPWGGTPEEFGARLKADFAKYGKLIAMTGARVE
ncbi:MAG: tripartite tricarboxylate transporter substrate binding protein [bacterium]|nr:tripartite tricarboxylate transporter substrate binding protein [Betaproteobacteria bacterium]